MDQRRCIGCVFIDFKKAFDVVDHNLLVRKLNSFNINPRIVKWIQEYLNLRSQYVVVNGAASETIDVTSGVPQGLVLGPLLFLVYINDVAENITSYMRLFADDCVVHREIRSEEDNYALQRDLFRIQRWCQEWNMKLNLGKTVHMCFSRKQDGPKSVYMIDSTPLQTVFEFKYLGIYLTPSLCWHRHVDFVTGKACKVLGFL